jgi:hypothetical protein
MTVMICLYQRPDKVMVRVSTSEHFRGARNFKPDDELWGKRAGDLAEGVYRENGEYLGSFVDYWRNVPP